MMKKLLVSSAAGMLALSSVAASAAPVAFEAADRSASPIADAEALGGGMFNDGAGFGWIVALLIAAGTAWVITSDEDEPVSP